MASACKLDYSLISLTLGHACLILNSSHSRCLWYTHSYCCGALKLLTTLIPHMESTSGVQFRYCIARITSSNITGKSHDLHGKIYGFNWPDLSQHTCFSRCTKNAICYHHRLSPTWKVSDWHATLLLAGYAMFGNSQSSNHDPMLGYRQCMDKFDRSPSIPLRPLTNEQHV